MAAIPIVNTIDKRKGIIASVIAMLLLLIAMFLIKFEIADPPPQDIVVTASTIIPKELKLDNLKVEGGGSKGAASDNPIDDPKPQTEKVITKKENPDTKEVTGESNNTNSPTSSNEASTTQQSNNPFGSGSSDSGQGSGNNGPFGTSTGPGSGTGSGTGGGGNVKRTLVKIPSIDDLRSNVDVTITLKVTIDPEGNVLYAQNVKGSTTTTNQILINKVINRVKSGAKYNKAPGSGLMTVSLPITIRAI